MQFKYTDFEKGIIDDNIGYYVFDNDLYCIGKIIYIVAYGDKEQKWYFQSEDIASLQELKEICYFISKLNKEKP